MDTRTDAILQGGISLLARLVHVVRGHQRGPPLVVPRGDDVRQGLLDPGSELPSPEVVQEDDLRLQYRLEEIELAHPGLPIEGRLKTPQHVLHVAEHARHALLQRQAAERRHGQVRLAYPRWSHQKQSAITQRILLGVPFGAFFGALQRKLLRPVIRGVVLEVALVVPAGGSRGPKELVHGPGAAAGRPPAGARTGEAPRAPPPEDATRSPPGPAR